MSRQLPGKGLVGPIGWWVARRSVANRLAVGPVCGLVVAGLVLLLTGSVQAQSRLGGTRTVGGGVTGLGDRSAGLTQTGELSSSAAIQRSDTAFVGSSSASAGNIRSLSGANTALGAGAGLGAGLSLGSNLGGFGGGLGGFGGGLGGFGGGLGGFGGLGAQQGRGQTGAGRQGQRAGTGQLPIRAPIRIGFTQASISGEVVSSRFQTRLTNLPGVSLMGPIEVVMDGQTAVLRGTVASENDRDLIARLAVLEPGISEVRNELTVAPPASR